MISTALEKGETWKKGGAIFITVVGGTERCVSTCYRQMNDELMPSFLMTINRNAIQRAMQVSYTQTPYLPLNDLQCRHNN